MGYTQGPLLPCVRKTVFCEIETACGQKVFGRNMCRPYDGKCLRGLLGVASGSANGVCGQIHAELVAIEAARLRGISLVGATATIYGHYYACEPCARALKEAGVTKIIIEEIA